MKRFITLVLVAFVALTGARSAQGQSVVTIDSPASLEERYESARSSAGRQATWIVFSFNKTMCKGCFSGTFKWDSEWERSIEDIILGREPAGESVNDAVRRTLRTMDDDESDYRQMVEKEVAVMVKLERGSVQAVQHANMTSSYPFEDETIYWLGNHTREAILSLVPFSEWESWAADARKGWVWTIGSLAVDPGTLTWLNRAYGSESDAEIRKAIAYAYGNVDSEGAVEALQRIISRDESREVQKAAIYALGNNETEAAREALLEIIWEMGSASSS